MRHVDTVHLDSYTDYNWCCGHHYTRSMKIDMFQVALDLLVNQRNHDEYVRQAKVFEDFARRTISSYWTGWTGVPTSLIMTGGAGTVVSTSTGPVLTASEPSNAPYQDLKTDRERLMGGLKRAIATLKSAEECTEISKGVLEIGRHCGNMTGIGFGVASLQQDLEVATQNVKDLTAKNKILKKAIADRLESERADAIAEEKSRSAAREKELLERITKSDESVVKIQADFRDREEQNKKMVQKMIDDQTEATRAASKIKDEESRRITGMTSLSTTLGQILHELNMQRNPNDLYAFGTLTEDGITPFGPGRMDMVARAQILGKIQRAIMERKPSFSSAFGDPS